MKILFLITGLGVGGAERQVCDLADSFQLLGHDVILVYMTGEVLVKPSGENIEIIPLRMEKGFFSFFKKLKKFTAIVNRKNPDVIHGHMFHANIFLRLSSIFFKKKLKIITTAHSSNEGGWLRMLAYRLTDKLVDISTNVSEEAVEIFEKKKAVPKGRMLAIHNGIDTRKFICKKEVGLAYRKDLKIEFDEKVFIAVGRLVDAKDYPNLILSFSIVSKKYKCKLLIVGDGILKEELMNQCIDSAIQDKVNFLGVRDDVNALMNAADYFVLSSAWEGFGLVVAEAMATEKIVIATDCGGVAEVVGDAGFLVPAKSPNLLAEAMEKALNLDENEAQIIRKKARSRIVSRYSLETACLKWIDLYKNL